MEHEVSMSSAAGVFTHIDRNQYNIHAVRLDKDGTWWLLDPNEPMDSPEALARAAGMRVVAGDPTIEGLVIIEPGERTLDIVRVDVAFPVLHGPFGEDGTFQGLAAMAGWPCVGSGVLGSSVGMDKVLMKQVFFQNDLPSTDFIWFTKKSWMAESDRILKAVNQEIGFPCFVKPANAGSSVGISKVKSAEELWTAINIAAEYDRKILVEKGVNARELECAVLGNHQPQTSVVGEILPGNEFYDYEAKYQSEGSRTLAPADIDNDIAEKIKWMAARAFSSLDCAGLGRVDFLLDKNNGDLFVNEINTIPGFTPISMYPHLWEKSGISYTELISKLIELAIEDHEDRKCLKNSRID